VSALNIAIRFLCVLVLFLSIFGCAHKAQTVSSKTLPEGELSVSITVSGLLCCKGVLRLAVYNDDDYWMSDTGMVRGRLGFIQSDMQKIEVHGLIPGRYAIAVYQDIDSDNKLDRWLGLIPKEPYGFSNNVGRYGPVSFEKASFELIEDKSITIKLNSR